MTRTPRRIWSRNMIGAAIRVACAMGSTRLVVAGSTAQIMQATIECMSGREPRQRGLVNGTDGWLDAPNRCIHARANGCAAVIADWGYAYRRPDGVSVIPVGAPGALTQSLRRIRSRLGEVVAPMAGLRATRGLRLLAALSILLVVVPVVANEFQTFPTRASGDPWNYLAAGERLNAGHPLYALSPGDRPVELHPPYWSVPLLSPPFVAVVWRPLAALGDAAMWAWWTGGVLATAAYVVWLLRRLVSPWAIFALVILSPPLVYGALSGNAIGYLVPMLALRHPAFVAVAAAVRLAPALFAPSVGLRATLGFGAGIAIVSLLGAGLENHLDWLRTVPSSAPTPNSISGLTGVPPILVAAACAIVALRGWRWAVVAVTLASPATYFYGFGFLSLLLVPVEERLEVGAGKGNRPGSTRRWFG